MATTIILWISVRPLWEDFSIIRKGLLEKEALTKADSKDLRMLRLSKRRAHSKRWRISYKKTTRIRNDLYPLIYIIIINSLQVSLLDEV